jgi:Ca2+-binding RTX toxin-like protein
MSYETTCRLDPAGVRAALGDGDDRLTASSELPKGMALSVDGGPGRDRLNAGTAGVAATLSGGDGDDEVSGGPGADHLDGGAGNDDVDGSGGPDWVQGGPGDDTLHGDHFEDPSPDVIDGGAGVDTLVDDYKSRFSDATPDVAVTLGGGADDGRPGEGDDVEGVEHVIVSGGGRLEGTDAPELLKAAQTLSTVTLDGRGGTDDLEGGGGRDTIDGGAGDDMIDGGFGDDVITGGPGRDMISADRAGGDCGPIWCTEPYGNDVVYARDGEADSISCGWGTDRVVADPQDVVASDCEQVDRGAPAGGGGAGGSGAGGHGAAVSLALVGHPSLRTALARGLRVRVKGAPGAVKVVATVSGRKVGAGAGRGVVRVRFGRAAARRLRHQRSVALVLTASGARARVKLRG